MKKVIAWIFRICCLAVIGMACYTVGISVLHMHDDHSYEALMGDQQIAMQPMDMSGQQLIPTGALPEEVDENPVVVLSCDDSVSPFQPYLSVTAAFSSIQNSITANLNWYVGDELVSSVSDRLLVEGSTVVASLRVKPTDDTDTSTIRLEVLFQEKTAEATKEIQIERFALTDSDTVRTEEITVTILEACTDYLDAELTSVAGKLDKDDTGLLRGYENFDEGNKSLQIQLSDGSGVVWVDAEHAEITEDECTTKQDYTQLTKEDFVNEMGYGSQTDYLVWVSLYTQRVNVFTGYAGHWTLTKTFTCSSGANSTPTTTGTFRYTEREERWDLGETYVEPVLIFNGGEAFTSRPKKSAGGRVADDTMGTPASGGSVRLLDEDIAWLYDMLPEQSMVVVY